MSERGARYLEFQKEVLRFLDYKGEDGEKAPRWPVLFKIVEDQHADFTFDFESMKGSCDLIVGAMLLAAKKHKRVVFLFPTWWHGLRAVSLVKAFVGTDLVPGLHICPVGWVSEQVALEADVFVHHGKDFRDELPRAAQKCRHVIQLFEINQKDE